MSLDTCANLTFSSGHDATSFLYSCLPVSRRYVMGVKKKSECGRICLFLFQQVRSLQSGCVIEGLTVVPLENMTACEELLAQVPSRILTQAWNSTS